MPAVVVTGERVDAHGLSRLTRWHLERLGLDVAAVADAPTRDDLRGADALVSVAWSTSGARRGAARRNIDAAARVLAAASDARVGRVVLVSSATVYGAWPDNPVPITEQCVLRPNPGCADAVERAEVERLVADWASEEPDRTAAVLRPVPIAGGAADWLSVALARSPWRGGDSPPPRQFVHPDDVASAAALAVNDGLEGVYNVAPDGWIAGDLARRLGSSRRVALGPGRVSSMVADWGWRARLTTVPPALAPLFDQPWVVANDRLRAAGWVPRYTNEEALVGSQPGSVWREMSPHRRQILALGAPAVAVTAGGVVAAAIVARRRSRRRAGAAP